MSGRHRGHRLVVLAGVVLLVAACGQEDRNLREIPPGASATDAVSLSELKPGGGIPESTSTSYEENAYAVGQGRQLYERMNCVGCHFHGGGGIGPALIDDEWIYGSDPSQIFKTIVEGRPNGMPSFKGKLTNQQLWQIVAFVRTLGGLGSSSIASSREDHMYLTINAATRPQEKPKGKTIPKP